MNKGLERANLYGPYKKLGCEVKAWVWLGYTELRESVFKTGEIKYIHLFSGEKETVKSEKWSYEKRNENSFLKLYPWRNGSGWDLKHRKDIYLSHLSCETGGKDGHQHGCPRMPKLKSLWKDFLRVSHLEWASMWSLENINIWLTSL